jgi:HlyD family secretion protein
VKSVSRFVFPLLMLAACHKAPPPPVYQAVPVQRRDIVVTAQAAGAINPDTVVDVKSKASGEILDVKVSTGDVVKHGTLIVQVDQRIPANDVAQAKAALGVDSAQLNNAVAQLNRQKSLFDAKAVTQQDYEAAQLAVAVSKAALVRDDVALQNAKINLGDTQVLAPITGTIISEAVQRGTVISSPNSSASGGTVILRMADLSLVQVKTWVDESDVGKLHAGQSADVIVAAYPNRPFKGTVLKIEPQADTIQNVTMFPVDIRIDNRDNLLKPGMNADVRIAVGQRSNVLAVPNAALRTEKDVASAGTVLGINPAELQQMLANAKKTFSDAAAQRSDTGAGATLPNATGSAAPPDTMNNRRRPAGAADSSSGTRGRRSSGSADSGKTATNGNGYGGGGGGGGGGRGGRGRGGRGGGGGDYSFGGRYIVFALKHGKAEPVYIQTGLTDLDYSEVKVGLVEGDSVLLLPSASLVQSQQQLQQRMSQNAGLPGQSKPPAGTTGAAAPAGGGGNRGGRGGP